MRERVRCYIIRSLVWVQVLPFPACCSDSQRESSTWRCYVPGRAKSWYSMHVCTDDLPYAMGLVEGPSSASRFVPGLPAAGTRGSGR